MVGVLLFLSLNCSNNDPKAIKKFYFISTILGLYMLGSFILMIYAVISVIFLSSDQNKEIMQGDDMERLPIIGNIEVIKILLYISGISYALPISFSLIDNRDKIFETLTSILHYFFFSPTYIHNCLIYAFTRIDDFSWGTKGKDTAEE